MSRSRRDRGHSRRRRGGRRRRAEIVLCPPATLLMAAAKLCEGSRACARRPGLPCGAERRAHRRLSGRNAEGRRRLLCDRRPFRTACRSWRDRRHRRRQGVGGLARGPLGHPLCRRDARRARGGRGFGKGRRRSSANPCRRTLPDAARLAIAYEPVWAIGTGLTPTPRPMSPPCMAFCGDELARQFPAEAAEIRILYGGSVKPGNAAELLGRRRMSTAPSSAARASRRRSFWRSPACIGASTQIAKSIYRIRHHELIDLIIC